MTISQEKLIAYSILQDQLAEVKADEAEMRKEICAELLQDRPVGTHTFEFDGIVVKATNKVTYSLDQELLSALYDNFSPDEKECIKYNPTFQSSKYKTARDTSLIDEVIVTKPAMPALKIIIEE